AARLTSKCCNRFKKSLEVCALAPLRPLWARKRTCCRLVMLLSFTKRFLDLHLDFGIPLDERRPGTFATFARQFLRRVMPSVSVHLPFARIIRASTFAVMRCTRESSLLKSRRGGFISPGGVESTMFHQQVPASKTMLPFGNS